MPIAKPFFLLPLALLGFLSPRPTEAQNTIRVRTIQDTSLVFIEPVDFTPTGTSKRKITGDFSFLVKSGEIRDTAYFNFSLTQPLKFKRIRGIVVTLPSSEEISLPAQLLFAERKRKKMVLRYSVKVPPTDFMRMISSPESSAILLSNTSGGVAPPAFLQPKWAKTVMDIYYILPDLFSTPPIKE